MRSFLTVLYSVMPAVWRQINVKKVLHNWNYEYIR